jgi:hypothetical protein
MQINNDEGEIRRITIIDEVSSIWKQSDGRIPVILRKHAQMYFLPFGMANFENYLGILKEAKLSEQPIRITFIEHSGEILSVSWAAMGAEGDE